MNDDRWASRAESTAAHALLGCVVRELAVDPHDTTVDDGHVVVRLVRSDEVLRVAVRRASALGVHRFEGPVQRRGGRGWVALTVPDLARLVARELTVRCGYGNEEFVGQVVAGRDTMARLLAARAERAPRGSTGADPATAYLESEQSLVAGHPRHPTPKWRSGPWTAWRRFTPETGSRFALRWLAVAADAVIEECVDDIGFDGHGRVPELLAGRNLPAGYRAVPVHPWQYSLVRADELTGPALARAIADHTVLDLGEEGVELHPTASVRTLYQPRLDVFLKTSLSVRITNCLRKNARYELTGAVALTRSLAPVLARVAVDHPGFAVLPEPAMRTVDLRGRHGSEGARDALAEGLGVIVRGGVRSHVRPGETALLAGSLVAERPAGVEAWHVSRSVAPPDVVEWWLAYLRLLVDPVLQLWHEHGIALEPHLQNVLVVIDRAGMPCRMLVRDLEGVKIGPGPHRSTLAALAPPVSAALACDEERGWNRVAYCLVVNHLVEVLAALADIRPELERELWNALLDRIDGVARRLGGPARLVALASGGPLPAKANLLLRWSRQADRHARYVPFRPLPTAAVR